MIEQLANSIAGAVIDAGAKILAVPGEYDNWGDEIEVWGHKFRLNQHFYVSYALTENTPDEYLNYVQPGQMSIVRGVRQIIKGGILSRLVKPKTVAGDLGFLIDSYPARYARELTFVGLREHNLFEKMVAIDDVPYMVMNCYQSGDGFKILLDRPLDQPVTHTSVLTGGRVDANKLHYLVKDGGLFVVSPKFRDSRIEGHRFDYEKHGINVRETRHFDGVKEATIVTIDVMMGITVYPQNCELLDG